MNIEMVHEYYDKVSCRMNDKARSVAELRETQSRCGWPLDQRRQLIQNRYRRKAMPLAASSCGPQCRGEDTEVRDDDDPQTVPPILTFRESGKWLLNTKLACVSPYPNSSFWRSQPWPIALHPSLVGPVLQTISATRRTSVPTLEKESHHGVGQLG